MKKSIAVTLFALISFVNLSTAVFIMHRNHGKMPVAVTEQTSAMPLPIDLSAYLGAK
jgi:hypothetical protein